MDFAPEDVLHTVLPKSWVMDYIFWQKTGLLQKRKLYLARAPMLLAPFYIRSPMVTLFSDDLPCDAQQS